MRVLSIDGGGVRGILPARALVELEALGGRPIADQFDLIAATAAGAVLALGLTAPGPGGAPRYSAEEMLGFHLAHGARMVKRRGRELAGSVRDLLGDARFGEALSHLIVPTFDLETARPVVFRSREFADHPRPLMREVAEATSAIPSRQRPVPIEIGAARRASLLHGGFAANNPVLLAYAAAHALAVPRPDPEPDWLTTMTGIGPRREGSEPITDRDPSVVLVSLGVGARRPPAIGYEASRPLRGWGRLGDSLTALTALLDGTGEATHEFFSAFVGAARPGDRYWRIQAPLEGCMPDMHAVDWADLECLLDVAEEMVELNRDRLTQIASAVAS